MSIKKIRFCDLCGNEMPTRIQNEHGVKKTYIDAISIEIPSDLYDTRVYGDICKECNDKLMAFMRNEFPLFRYGELLC